MRRRDAEKRARRIVWGEDAYMWCTHDGKTYTYDLECLAQLLADEFAALEPVHRDTKRKRK